MSGWMTVPEWAGVKQVDVFRREQDNSSPPETAAPQNLHVLVRGQVELPPGSCTLRISADDYYHAWLDGEWLGQGPAPDYHDRYYYQEYPVAGQGRGRRPPPRPRRGAAGLRPRAGGDAPRRRPGACGGAAHPPLRRGAGRNRPGAV